MKDEGRWTKKKGEVKGERKKAKKAKRIYNGQLTKISESSLVL